MKPIILKLAMLPIASVIVICLYFIALVINIFHFPSCELQPHDNYLVLCCLKIAPCSNISASVQIVHGEIYSCMACLMAITRNLDSVTDKRTIQTDMDSQPGEGRGVKRERETNRQIDGQSAEYTGRQSGGLTDRQ